MWTRYYLGAGGINPDKDVSLIVIPPAAARNVSRNLRQQIILSILFGVGGGLLGIALSYQLNVPCGPTIVLSCIAIFVACLALSKRTRVAAGVRRL